MILKKAITFLLLGISPLWAVAGPAEALVAAVADQNKLPVTVRPLTRYLTLPEQDLKAWVDGLNFICNSLSTESEMYSVRMVTKDLVAINISDYNWKRETWDKLAQTDPYFHVHLTDGKIASSLFLNPQHITDLITSTQSEAPILRGDWFLTQVSQQVDRKVGYYDFLGVGKTLADFQKIVGVDEEAAKRLKKEMAAIVTRSGVAINNRKIYRYQGITGSYWVTFDTINSIGERNVARKLDGDLTFDANEIYGTLPNGLFAFFLSDSKGKRQDSVPDNIAFDHESTSNDRRIHPGISCIRCHTEGLRNIDDWARKTLRLPLSIQSPDYDKIKRFRQLYLSNLQRNFLRDKSDYAAALKECNGLTPEENARNFSRIWERYNDVDLGVSDVARELGCTEVNLLSKLKDYAAKTGSLDPVLAGLLAVPPVPIRREHMDEVFIIAQGIVRGQIIK